MTVEQLIEKLKLLDEGAHVIVAVGSDGSDKQGSNFVAVMDVVGRGAAVLLNTAPLAQSLETQSSKAALLLTSTQPTNAYEALVVALMLAITAPDEGKASECLAMAQSFAASLSELEVARAKREALRKIAGESSEP